MNAGWDKNFAIDVIYRSMCLVNDIRGNGKWKLKPDGTLLTEVDPANEDFLRKELTSGGDNFIGEESIEREGVDFVQRAMKGRTWVVDPIDGTAPFAHNLPTWAISIGYMVDGKFSDGIFALPDLKRCFVTDGDDVLVCFDVTGKPADWEWHKMAVPADVWNPGMAIMLGQGMARHGDINLPNPVIAGGSAVHSISSVVANEAIGFVGGGKIWDIASAFPMLFRLGYRVKSFNGPEIVADISDGKSFILDGNSDYCWHPQNGTFVCARPGNGDIIEKAIARIA